MRTLFFPEGLRVNCILTGNSAKKCYKLSMIRLVRVQTAEKPKMVANTYPITVTGESDLADLASPASASFSITLAACRA